MRLRERMDQHTTRRALGMVGETETEIGDTEVPGLSIRVRKAAATWCLRGRLGPKQSVWTIGPVGGSKGISLTDARRRATEAKDRLRNGTDPGPWLQEMATGAPVERTFKPALDGMGWDDGKAMFLEHVKAKRAAATYNDYRRTLDSADFKPFQGRLLKAISQNDVRRLRDGIEKRGRRAQADHSLRILKSCLAWLAERADTGITTSIARDVKPPEMATEDKRNQGAKLGRVPDLAELGRLPWQLAATTGTPRARLIAALILFTAQRIHTVSTARKQDFEEVEDGAIWSIPAAHTKSKRGHTIPLPPVAWNIVRQAIALSPMGNPLVFPATKARDDTHVSYKAVRDALEEAGTRIKPHDVRRAFGTHGEDRLGFALPELKIILDHAEGAGNDVTRQRYALGDRKHPKWRLMLAWEGWLKELAAEQAPAGSGPLPAFLSP